MPLRSDWVVDKTEAVSRDGMVAAIQPHAADAGAEILRRGGNAVDAAVATAFAVGVVDPAMSGVGGVAFLTYRDAASKQTVVFDGSSTLPPAIRPEMFTLLPRDVDSDSPYGWRATKDDAANTGWLTPAVPGMPAALGEAHRRFGNMPWRDLLEPAIALAQEGFEVNYEVALVLAANYARLSRFAESSRTFLRPDGGPLRSEVMLLPGDRLVQQDLATSLRLIAEEGSDALYRGQLADLIAEDMEANGGLITLDDLASYETQIIEPGYLGEYRGLEIFGQIENSGCATLIEALNILEGFDLRGAGYQSAASIHLQAEAVRLAFLDRLRYLGDASLAPVPYEAMISKEYAAARHDEIDVTRANPDAEPGNPWSFQTSKGTSPTRTSAPPRETETTHLTVIDRDRNMVSLTSTLGMLFGSAVVIRGTGITLNNGTTWFDPEPGSVTSIGPGKRLMSAAAPIVITRHSRPFLAIGAPGGRRVISSVVQCIVNIVDFDLGMQAAVSAPRVHSEGGQTFVSGRFPSGVVNALRDMGHDLVVWEEHLSAGFFARPNGILVDENTGELRAGVFQYNPSTAVGI